MKKRLILVTAAVLLALTPAAAGAIGNTSLSHRVPVSGPTRTVEPGDDNGGLVDRDLRTEPGDDRDANGAPAPSASATSTPEAGDDKGGLRDRDQRTEPGDDRDDRRSSDDSSGHRGDDSGRDDHGGSRHGGDDD